jgi:hypothetical protein
MKSQLFTAGRTPAMHGPRPEKGVVVGKAARNPMYIKLGGFSIYTLAGTHSLLYFAAPTDIPQMTAVRVADYRFVDGRLVSSQVEEVGRG